MKIEADHTQIAQQTTREALSAFNSVGAAYSKGFREGTRVVLNELFRAIGADPNEIPLGRDVEITRDGVTFQRFLRDEVGDYLLNPEGDDVETESVTLPWP